MATPDDTTTSPGGGSSQPTADGGERARIAELARATSSSPSVLAAAVDEPTLAASGRAYLGRLRGGDIGSLPAVLGLIALFILFSALRPGTFASPINIANLIVQASSIIVLAMGLTFVLLLGEIDLSAGTAGGASAAVMAMVLKGSGAPWWVGVPAGILTGVAIGVLIGLMVARVGIPSFVVTLAFFLGLQGVTLRLIGQGGTVRVSDDVVVSLANGNVPVIAGWGLAIIAAVVYAALTLRRWNHQRTRGLSRDNRVVVLARAVGVAIAVLGLTWILSQNRARVPTIDLSGMPWTVPLIAVLLVVLTVVLGRTTYGRHVYAVGGNAEAARRAGINVKRIRLSVFMIGSGMAALSGIIEASRLNSVTPDSGAGNQLLLGVGAAVIGGTSLFGGKGKVSNAIIGGLVVATITNGLGLLGQAAYVNFLVTGGVLLLAATVDAVSRRRRTTS